MAKKDDNARQRDESEVVVDVPLPPNDDAAKVAQLDSSSDSASGARLAAPRVSVKGSPFHTAAITPLTGVFNSPATLEEKLNRDTVIPIIITIGITFGTKTTAGEVGRRQTGD